MCLFLDKQALPPNPEPPTIARGFRCFGKITGYSVANTYVYRVLGGVATPIGSIKADEAQNLTAPLSSGARMLLNTNCSSTFAASNGCNDNFAEHPPVNGLERSHVFVLDVGKSFVYLF